MFFKPDALTLILLLVVAANIIGIAAYVLTIRLKARREKRDTAAMKAAIIDYFRKSGVGVSVSCVGAKQKGRFNAFIESEPMKRFRLSHIIEMTLREHMRKTCGLELEKIFWRFPIKEAGPDAGNGEAEAEQDLEDEYITEGLDHYRHIPQPEVTELPWEHFEEVVTIDRNKAAAQKTE